MPSKKKQKKDNVKKLREEVKLDAGAEVEAAEEDDVISKKKVIYIEIDDEVGAVYDKIHAVKGNHVYIVAPQKAVIFQSIVNLKILKRKAKEESKTTYFITNDKNGIYLAQQVGITIYDKENVDGKPSLFSTDVSDEKLRITPLRAAVNAVEEDAPTRLAERKLSISEILRKRRGRKDMDVSRISPLKKKKAKKKKTPKFVIVAPNRQALIALTVFSVFILLTIIYIALPGVTIYLTPSAGVLEKSVNITLADYQRNKAELDTRPTHMIASYSIAVTVEKTITHYSTGKKFSERNTNASGYLTIINMTNIEWPLVPKTRFQTDEGLVFRISDYATVPRSTNEGPGKIEVYVTADPVDAYGEAVGERGNIGPTKFFLPGLKESSQSKLYGESYELMTGGITDFVTYVSAEDVEAAKGRMRDTLIQSAAEELKLAVEEKDDLVGNEITYVLLDGEGAIKLGEPVIKILPDLEGKEISEFNVAGEIYVSGVYYDKDEMPNILKSELLLKKSPQKELLRINDDSISYRIFEEDEVRAKIKLTANIKGIEQYEIDPEKENGARLLKKIKDHIVGKDIEDAKVYIQNLPEINKVEIESWPAWSPTIPNIPDNIEFEVRPALTVE